MSERNPSSEAALTRFWEFNQAQLHTALPAFVEKWNDADLTADVTPVFTDYFETDGAKPQGIPYPKLLGVPIAYPCGGDFSVVWPLKKGDPVLLLVMERSIQEWFNSDGGKQLTQSDIRMHHLSDAVVIPGLMPAKKRTKKYNKTDLVIGLPTGAKVRYGSETADKALALAQKVNQELQSIVLQFNTHFHPSPFMVPVKPMGAPADTGSERIFADA